MKWRPVNYLKVENMGFKQVDDFKYLGVNTNIMHKKKNKESQMEINVTSVQIGYWNRYYYQENQKLLCIQTVLGR